MLITLQRESSVLYDVKVLYRLHQVTCAFSSAGLRTSFLTIFAPDMQLYYSREAIEARSQARRRQVAWLCGVCFQVSKEPPLRLVERLWPRKWHAIDNAYAGRGQSTSVYSGAHTWAIEMLQALDWTSRSSVGEILPT